MRFPFRRAYRTLNTVSLSADALRHNLALYRELLPGKAVCPVLKANAYGHGLKEVARVVDRDRPAFLIVDSLYEAYELRKVGVQSRILILGVTFPENVRGRRLPFHFAVSDAESARVLALSGASLHLKVDTGMNRMGFSVEELPEVLRHLKEWKADVAGVCTHLAEADHPLDDSYTEVQVRCFEEALRVVRAAGFYPEWIHAGQSAGSLKTPDVGNMVRLGLGLYGLSPFASPNRFGESLAGLRPVMEFRSTVVSVRSLLPGDRVSYGGTFVAERPIKVAVVPIGYYEGLPWALSGRGVLKVRDKVCPMVGRVCMNYTMIDVSNVDGVAIGDGVEVFSREAGAANSIELLAEQAGTIPYELMTRVAASVRREVDWG